MITSICIRSIRKGIIILCFLSISSPGPAQAYKGTIVKVIDGDTYIFQTDQGSFRVRSYGIDTPEGNQPFGTKARHIDHIAPE
jgi:endonuclease YncB( thermonuclease family)